MKTPLAGLAIAVLLLGAGGCQVGGGTVDGTGTIASLSEATTANFGVFGFTPIGIDKGSADQLNVDRPSGAFTATKSVVAEDRTFTLSQAHQVFEVSDSQPAPVLAAKAVLGSAIFNYVESNNIKTLNRDFNGQLGTSDNGNGNPINPDVTVNDGWAYIQLEPGYSNSAATGYRPIVRTKRVIAMSQGTQMLIFNDADPNSSEEFIINRAISGGNILVTLNGNPTSIVLAPGRFIRVTGTATAPTSSQPRLLTGLDADSKLKKFLIYARRARKVAFNTDTGE